MALVLDDYLVIAPLVYTLPSYALCILELYIMTFSKSSKKFGSSFFFIARSACYCDVIYHILYTVVNRWRLSPWLSQVYGLLPTESLAYPVMFATCYSAGNMSLFIMNIMALNRLSVFFLNVRHDVFWKFSFKFIYTPCIIVACGLNWHFFFTKVKLIDLDGTWLLDETEKLPWWSTSLISSSMIFTMTLLAFVINVTSGVFLAFYLSKNSPQNMNGRFFFVSLFIFAGQLLNAASQSLFIVPRSQEFAMTFFKCHGFIIDINNLTLPWVLLFMNRALRKKIFSKFFGSQEVSVVVSGALNSKVHPTSRTRW